eukprot:4871037-Amphidinium_carterae.1
MATDVLLDVYGLVLAPRWGSPTEDLNALSTCEDAEHLLRRKIAKQYYLNSKNHTETRSTEVRRHSRRLHLACGKQNPKSRGKSPIPSIPY